MAEKDDFGGLAIYIPFLVAIACLVLQFIAFTDLGQFKVFKLAIAWTGASAAIAYVVLAFFQSRGRILSIFTAAFWCGNAWLSFSSAIWFSVK